LQSHLTATSLIILPFLPLTFLQVAVQAESLAAAELMCAALKEKTAIQNTRPLAAEASCWHASPASSVAGTERDAVIQLNAPDTPMEEGSVDLSVARSRAATVDNGTASAAASIAVSRATSASNLAALAKSEENARLEEESAAAAAAVAIATEIANANAAANDATAAAAASATAMAALTAEHTRLQNQLRNVETLNSREVEGLREQLQVSLCRSSDRNSSL
jgi:hypothetical protein